MPRKSLFYKLSRYGISSKIIKLLTNIYTGSRSAVWNGEELSEYFNTESGLKQGCLLSPLLFTLYLNDMHDHIQGGIIMDNLNIKLLMYADDIVMIADDVNIHTKK